MAALLLKLGGYGLLRISVPIFNIGMYYFYPIIYMLSILSILYTSITIFRQLDLKRIIAYSSIAHMNLIVLGIMSGYLEGVTGGIFLDRK